MKYLASLSSGITDRVSHNFARSRIAKNIDFSVVNKSKNESYHNIFSEKGLHRDKSNTQLYLNDWLYIIYAIF